MTMKNIRTMTLVAMFAALVAIVSQISIPMPSQVPLTLQTFAIALTGCMLGAKHGSMAVIVYILLGAVGLPIFSNFKGGLGTLFGYTGGFIFGFIFMAVLCGLGAKQKKHIGILLSFAGALITHVCGVIWFSIITKNGLFASAIQISLPYLIKDTLSAIAACFCADMLKKRLKFIED